MTMLDEQFTAVLQKSPAHKLPIKAEVRRAIGKEAGDTALLHLDERIDA
jgi:hypothetical protein